MNNQNQTPPPLATAQPGALTIANPGLIDLAAFIRATYPQCRPLIAEFNTRRFAIGLALLIVRRLIAHGNVQIKLNTLSHIPKISLAPRFTAERAGLIAWAKREFPDIPYRTLSRYREWAEYEALPKVLAQRQQLEFPLDALSPRSILALPAPQLAQLQNVLKMAVNGRDLSLTLRAMDEMPAPCNRGQKLPPGSISPKVARRRRLADNRVKARNWLNVLRAHLALFQNAGDPLWEDLTQQDRSTLENLSKLASTAWPPPKKGCPDENASPESR